MTSIQRPSYFEGQVLAARDLTSAVDYARGRSQRHAVFAHRWGIHAGLALGATPGRTDKNVAFVEVTVGAGIATDGAGREVLVPAEVPLRPSDFERSNVKVEDPDAWYPVSLRHREDEATAASSALGPCGDARQRPTRVTESAELHFGRPGTAGDLEARALPGAGEDLAAIEPWSVLIGYVQWSEEARAFGAIRDEVGGVGRRYAGVRAAVVESPGDTLTLLTRPETEPGAPVARIDREELAFGLQDGSGGMSKLFTVNRKGEVTAGGQPLGGGVRIASGLISHGARVPLPPNVSEQAARDGKVTLHIQVSPLITDVPAGALVWAPEICCVDADRRVHCKLRVLLPGEATESRPCICNYTVVAVSTEPAA